MASKTTNTSSHRQQTISSFFSKKRKSSPIDLTASNDSDDSELLPPVKKIKNGQVKYLSSSRDTPESSKGSTARPLLRSFAQSHSKRRVSLLSSVDDGVSNNKGKGRSRDTSNLPLRDNLRRTDVIEKDRQMGASGSTKSLDGFTTYNGGSNAQIANCNPIDLEESSAEDNSLPWKKGNSSRHNRKISSVIGPAGLPCTPLEEAVSVSDHNFAWLLNRRRPNR